MSDGDKGWQGQDGKGSGARGGTIQGQTLATIGTLAIIALSPILVTITWHAYAFDEGKLTTLVLDLKSRGPLFLKEITPIPSASAWKKLGSFAAFQAVVQLLAPGRRFKGPKTVTGHEPVYKANGIFSFLITHACLFLLWWLKALNPTEIAYQYGEILVALNISAVVLCLFLCLKGLLLPSTKDSGSSGNPVFDFYWGTELYPRIGTAFDIKQFTNCRMGMMLWSSLSSIFLLYQLERDQKQVDHGLACCVFLLQVYITKFFVWEGGYFYTMDVQHDRAGFYICWGCLVWVPSVYTSPAWHLACNASRVGPATAACIATLGLVFILVNYDADRQRQEVRRKNGKTKLWGNKPKVIRARYTDSEGVDSSSLLLASGYWGISRHFHYVPEILASVMWTCPAGFDALLPYFYSSFLTILLLDRANRDDERCFDKYGRFWEEYRRIVPSRVVPGLY